jgi:hypothetical protein
VRAYIPEIKEADVAPLDLRGFLLAGVSLASLVFGFEAMGRGLLPTAFVVGLLVAGLGCGAFYVAHAKRHHAPIIDLSLLRIRTFRASLTGGGLYFMTTTSIVFLLALMLQRGLGYSAFEAGLTTLAGAAGSLVTRFAFRPILRFTGFRRLLIYNALVTAAYLFACGFFRLSTPYLFMLTILFVGGLSRSTQFSAIQSLSYAEMPSNLMSRATSFSAMNQQLAQSFGVGLAALVIHLSLLWRGSSDLTAADIAPGCFAIGCAAIGSCLIFLRLPVGAGAELEGHSDRRIGRAG